MSPAAQKKADEYQMFLQTMQEMLGVIVGDEKQAIVTEKLAPVMESHGFKSLDTLAEAMRDDDGSLRLSVLQAITERDSVWFDYPEVTSLLNEYVLPGIVNQNPANFRIWVVGCGQGQIAYSLAMTIDAFSKQYSLGCTIEIVATDMSEEAVKRASDGSFTSTQLSGLSTANRQEYMSETDGLWEVGSSLRSMIHFETCDLLTGIGQMGHCDLIICAELLGCISPSRISPKIQLRLWVQMVTKYAPGWE